MNLCRTFHCLPSQIMEEDAEVLRWMTIEALARKEETPGG